MVAVSLALFIFDEIMRPSVTTYVSEGSRITDFWVFIRIIDFSMAMACLPVCELRFEVEQASRDLSAIAELLVVIEIVIELFQNEHCTNTAIRPVRYIRISLCYFCFR